VDTYEARSRITLVLPYAFLVLAVIALARNGTPWNGLWWLLLAGLGGLTVPWRVRVDEECLTLWFSFGRRTRYARAEVAIVKNWGAYRSLALKGRRWWGYGLPGSIGRGSAGIDAAAQALGYATLKAREVATFGSRAEEKHDDSQP